MGEEQRRWLIRQDHQCSFIFYLLDLCQDGHSGTCFEGDNRVLGGERVRRVRSGTSSRQVWSERTSLLDTLFVVGLMADIQMRGSPTAELFFDNVEIPEGPLRHTVEGVTS